MLQFACDVSPEISHKLAGYRRTQGDP